MIQVESNTRVCANESPAFGSFTVTLADDESMKMPLPIGYGHVLVAGSSITSHGMAWVRNSAAVKYFGGANFSVMSNVVLEGATGTDGQLTVSTNAGNFFLENRIGSSVSVSITFLGVATNRV